MKLSRLLLISAVVGAIGGYLCEPWLRDLFFAEKKKPVVVARPAPKPEPVVAPEPEPQPEPAPEPVPEPQPEPEPEDEIVPEEIAKVEPENTGELKEANLQGGIQASAWGAPSSLEKQLSSRIRSGLKGKDVKSVQAFIKEPENRLMLAQWELLHRADLKELGKVMKGEVARDLAPLLNDLRWVSGLVYDGELEKPEVVLAMVHHFRQVDKEMDKDINAGKEGSEPNHLKRRVAAAVATEFTRNGWYGDDKELTPKDIQLMREQGIVLSRRGGKGKTDTYRLARERYLYFAESADGELLNASFETMPNWLLYFVCGWKGDSPFGTATTMRWLRDNLSAPAHYYTGMAYQVPYRPTNMFGDSIHGEYYYQPFEPLYEGNFTKMTRDVGSVCGGLSHFGAASSCANGVPAITMGEPGHCAYAVFEGGKWHACNSIGEEHHPHWSIWGDYSWSALMMQTAMYQDAARTRDAQYVCTIASVFADQRNADTALDIYEMSAAIQPLFKPVLSHYIDTATESLRGNARKWLGVNKFICESVAKNHPAMCAKFLSEKIYPAMFAHVRGDKHKMQAFSDFFANVDKNEGGTWDINALLDQQYNSIGKQQTRRLEFMKMIIDVGAAKPDFSQAIAWALRTATQENKRLGEKVFAMAEAAVANSPDKELMDAAFIRAGEELGDTALVHKYSASYLDKATEELPFFDRPAGTLVSPEGYVLVDMPFADQRIFTRHQAALTEKGGFIRSEPGKHQRVTVVLPKVTPLGAVVIIPKGGTKEYREWNVEISSDGKSWQHLMRLPDSADDKYVRVDVTGGQKARYIRIDSGEKQEVGIQFNAILVYDNKKAK